MTQHLIEEVRIHPLQRTSAEVAIMTRPQRERRVEHPEVIAEIMELESLIADRLDIPASRKKWGWGAWRHLDPAMMEAQRAKLGPLCSSCAVA